MTNKPENPQAFPPFLPEGHYNGSVDREGMTLRDYFAAAALQGLTASHLFLFNNANENQTTAASVAACAYLIANAMLAERAKQNV